VRIRAAGVGSTDLTVIAGNYSFAPKIPFVPGYEIAGTVDALGPGVTGLHVGLLASASSGTVTHRSGPQSARPRL